MLRTRAVLLLLVAASTGTVAMVIESEEDLVETTTIAYCPGLITPVCGSDGNLYYNECDLKSHDGVAKGDWEECNNTHCHYRGCPRIYKPTCDANGKIHNSWCELLVSNCGKQSPVNEEPLINCTNKICPENCDENDEDCKKLDETCRNKYLPYVTST